ncbi:MAG: prephenate dehydratase [Betaproteobacteria bacterium]|nr:prephenate dehydratase [Betaproteobacteria bacterium]
MDDRILRLRDRIDAIDAEILALVSERAQCANDIGHLKGGGVVYRPEREAQVLRRLTDLNRGPLPASAVQHLFVEIISACRALESTMRVAFLGPRGTYSEEATLKQFGAGTELEACASIPEVFHRVESSFAGYGVVPVENSTEGGIGVTLDLLFATNLRICGEVLLPIHHCLLTNAETAQDVSAVYGHAQALAQCNAWLSRHLPGVERIAVASNGEAARRAGSEAAAAAIASRAAGELYGVRVHASNIEDEPSNTTRFLVIGDQEVAPSGRDKTSIVMSAPNRPGGLHELLGPIAQHQVSLSRLESRPSRTGLWEYVFYLDVEGHEQDERVAQAIAELKRQTAFLKILGSYPAAAG